MRSCYEAAAGTLGAKVSSVKIYSCEEEIKIQTAGTEI